MKRHFQKMASLALAFALCLGLMVVPARADFWEGIKYNVTSVWDFLTTGNTDWNLRDSIGSYTGGTWMEKYANYVDDLITGLGTDTIGEHGYLMPLPATGWVADGCELVEFSPGPPSVLAVKSSGSVWYHLQFRYSAPVTGTFILRLMLAFTISATVPSGLDRDKSVAFVKGDPLEFDISGWVPSMSAPTISRRSVSAYLEVQPYDYTADGFLGEYGGSLSRPGNLDTTVGTDVKFGVTSTV